MDHLVTISLCVELVELVAQVNRMEAIPLIFLEIFDMVQVGRRILIWSSHVAGGV